MGNNGHKHIWTEDEREIVRRDYAHTHASRRAIAQHLGISEFAVAGQIAKMGIAKRSDRRRWARQEDERLMELMPRYSPGKIAKLLHRSLNSVVVRSKRLGISRRVRDGWFTKQEVGEILGVDHHWIQRRIDCGALKATYHYGVRPQKNGAVCWHIAEADLRRFIRRYPCELTSRNVDLLMIVDILAGVEAL